MITTDYPAELERKVVDAIKCTFASCTSDRDREIAEYAIVEFLTAMNFDADEAIEVLKRSDGMDAETDRSIDKLIEAFEEEAAE